MKIVNEDNQVVPRGQTSEALVRGFRSNSQGLLEQTGGDKGNIPPGWLDADR